MGIGQNYLDEVVLILDGILNDKSIGRELCFNVVFKENYNRDLKIHL